MAFTSDQLGIAVVAIMGLQGAWLSFLTYLMWRNADQRSGTGPEAGDRRKAEQDTLVEDLFLLARSGILVRHYTRRLRRMVDSDVLGGMLTAIHDFVKDSLRSEPGELREIRFGEVRIQVAVGSTAMLAMVVRGERPADLVPRMQSLLAQLESRHPDFLEEWDDTQQLPREAERLVEAFVADPLAFPAAKTPATAVVRTARNARD